MTHVQATRSVSLPLRRQPGRGAFGSTAIRMALCAGIALAVFAPSANSSRAATLRAPSNDDLASAASIGALPFETVVNTREATSESGEAASACGIGAGRGVWYRLTPDRAMTLRLSTIGSQRSAVLSAWIDQDHPLQEVACRDDQSPQSDGSGAFYLRVVSQRTVYIKVESRGLGGDMALAVEALAAPPPNDHLANAAAVTALPFDAAVDIGGATIEAGEAASSCYAGNLRGAWFRYVAPDDATLTLYADDADQATLISVWRGTRHPLSEVGCQQDTSPVPGESTLSVATVRGSTYYVRVEGPTYGATVHRLTLRIAAGPPALPAAANDDLANAMSVTTLPFQSTNNLTGATLERDELRSSCGSGEGTVWWRVLHATDIQAKISATAATYGLELSVWTGTDHPLAEIDCAFGSSLVVPMDAGTAYFVRVAGVSPTSEAAVLRIEPPPSPPANDDLAQAVAIDALPFTAGADIDAATAEPNELVACGVGRSVWYRFTAPTDGDYSFDTAGSNFDTMLSLWTGSGHPLDGLACSDDTEGGTWSRIVTFLSGGTTYWIKVDSYGAAFGHAVLNASTASATSTPSAPGSSTATPTPTPTTRDDTARATLQGETRGVATVYLSVALREGD